MKRLLFVDSRDRKDSQNVFNYTIDIENEVGVEAFRNVKCVRLKHIAFPKIKNEHYFILDIPQLNDHMDSTDNAGSHRASAVVYYDKSDMPAGGLKPSFENFEFPCTAPYPVLSKLTFIFKKYGGDVVSMNDIDTNISNGEHSMLLEIEFM